jgi:hypothetical protein
MTFRSLVLVALLTACARAPAPDVASTLPAPPTGGSSLPSSPAHASSIETPSASGPASANDGAPPVALAETHDGATKDDSPPQLPGEDFIDQARVLFQVAACGSGGSIPARFDIAVVTRHCDDLARAYGEYKKSWLDVAEPFFESLRPKDLPRVVVYPFGGGDLVSALATFPDATEITTISLEPAGDVRPIDALAPDRLARELAIHRAHLERLFEKAHSRTENLERESKAELPGEILFALAALVVHGETPLSLRYFRLRPDGSPVYVTRADLDAVKRAGTSERRALFANAELRFRRAGDPGAPVQVLRHLSFNLDDEHLKADPSLLAHLSAKGKVAAMTKAATHLLWNEHFSLIRTWLVDHTDWMVSDSTGIPPRVAGPAGFAQDTYGTFDGPSPFGLPDARDALDLKKLFASEPSRSLPFRYGYPDKDGHAHLIVTRRASR